MQALAAVGATSQNSLLWTTKKPLETNGFVDILE